MQRTFGNKRVGSLGHLPPALLVALYLAAALHAQPVLSKEYIRLGGRIVATEN
jgi:hypothetical protein